MALIGALLGLLAAVLYSVGGDGHSEVSDSIVVLGILGILIGSAIGGVAGSLLAEPRGD